MHNALDDSVDGRSHEWIAGVERWIKNNAHSTDCHFEKLWTLFE